MTTQSETSEENTYTVGGGDWGEFVSSVEDQRGEGRSGDQIVINMGPQHPSTHGLIRFILTLEGESVTDVRVSIGYLHTGIEKNMEFRTWTQGVTFCTRMDYLSPIFNETVYCLAVERLLGIEKEIPERASVIRVLMMELNRIASHLMSVGAFGLELGASTIFLYSLRERERILNVMEMITGLRMNHAYIRPGGVAQELPPGSLESLRDLVASMPEQVMKLHKLLDGNPVYRARSQGIAYLDLEGCMALGVTGPALRSTSLPWDLRKSQPYCGYESYDFEVATHDTCDVWGRYLVRMKEIDESLKIIAQCVERLSDKRSTGTPVMIPDAKVGWPARLSLGPDGLGPSPEHVSHIMGESMESLIHHFKLVTEGFRVPAGQAYGSVESPRGELGAHVVSDGGTRPYRVHFRDPSFHHLQSIPVMCEGGNLADVICAIASIDPVVGGVDR